MGYTHYFDQRRNLTREEWAEITDAAEKIIRASAYPICSEYDAPNEPPRIGPELIAFNGPGEDGHETFWLPRCREGYLFCKTAEKPYDVVVTALLIAIHGIAPRALAITSDGGSEDWGPGLLLAHQALGKPLVIPPGVIDRKAA